jgi:hypothetical protein
MPTHPIVIKVWCQTDNLQHTATMLSHATGHRVEIPIVVEKSKYTYIFIITEIEQYTDEKLAGAAFGFDIIGKIAGVLSWEILPKEQSPSQESQQSLSEAEAQLLHLLENLPLSIAIIQQSNGTFTWRWINAHGEANTLLDAAHNALSHVMKSYQTIRSELIG